MKNILLATTLLITFSSAAFANEKNGGAKLYKDLSATLKSSTQVCWMNKSGYNQAMFMFNDQVASAFYSENDNELIGFGIFLNKADLPEAVSGAIAKKYGSWEIVDAMIFIDTNGNLNYFTQVKKNNKGFALKITPGGSLSVYNTIPY